MHVHFNRFSDFIATEDKHARKYVHIFTKKKVKF